jgi:hypothetical protein
MDWEGIYIGNTLAYQNHTADITDITLEDGTVICSITGKQLNMPQLGLTRLPDKLIDLKEHVDFQETVVENKQEWEDKLCTTITEFSGNPTKEELCNELDISVEHFKVIKAVFMPEGVFNNNTAFGETAILANVEDENGGIKSEYTLMQSSNAKSYE